MGRFLIIVGLTIVVIGLLWPWLTRLGLGRLPGDIYIQGKRGSLYIPPFQIRSATGQHRRDGGVSGGGKG
ncbi:MAG: DUF2905 domain-containing protein, partial [Rhodoplanes sp.]